LTGVGVGLDCFGGATAGALGEAFGFTASTEYKLARAKVSSTQIRMLFRARRSVLGIRSVWYSGVAKIYPAANTRRMRWLEDTAVRTEVAILPNYMVRRSYICMDIFTSTPTQRAGRCQSSAHTARTHAQLTDKNPLGLDFDQVHGHKVRGRRDNDARLPFFVLPTDPGEDNDTANKRSLFLSPNSGNLREVFVQMLYS
jgi:hypothetical protein